ncbi:DinB family protein [Paenibacillus dendritiformis]|uniref:DinB family protein n=1 Tax=Paenibacillus dendritiformis TaxID=130049 RepID=UPI00248C484F|nr:DinB family protein [Paenibacillus dendritiformis]WGU96433.1 DinB family protein [Paenibacillus dendritiformis]
MINMENIYLVTDIPGYSPHISRLISMMNYARFTTIEEVKNLSKDQLDFLLDSQSNSIGALLLHFAAVEYAHQVATFEKRDLNEEEIIAWGPALDLGKEGQEKIKGNDLMFYLTKMEQVRNRTLDFFKSVKDDWLYIEEQFWYNKQANHYFMWFHVFEDEINHRGQIRMIRKRLNV